MMVGIIIAVVAVGIGIFVMYDKKAPPPLPKEQYLKKMADYFEGRYEPPTDSGPTHRVYFQFENQEFVFEDTEKVGFGKHTDAGYLKIKTSSPLNLTFAEKEQAKSVKSDIIIASQIPNEPLEAMAKLRIPKALKDFNVFTSDPIQASELLEDPKAGPIFVNYKNHDQRGYPFMSLLIRQGTLMLEFHPVIGFKPSLLDLRKNVPSLEDYAHQLIAVAQAVEQIHKKYMNR
jgi:hypothetical protein